LNPTATLVQRRLIECLSRDRTKHQVAEITSLGLIQMTRKKLGLGLLETFGETCDICAGRGLIVHHEPVAKARSEGSNNDQPSSGSGRRTRAKATPQKSTPTASAGTHEITDSARNALAAIATSTVNQDSSETAKKATTKPVSDLDSLLKTIPEAAGPEERKARRSRRASKPLTVTPDESGDQA
jgi:ribonuclease E